jgi:hypothetical protein
VATAKESPAAVPVTRGCQALALSRATYDRWRGAGPMPAPAMEVRAQIQEVALQMPAYGYRRITHALRRRGVAVNHKRVLRLMRADNLLCLRVEARKHIGHFIEEVCNEQQLHSALGVRPPFARTSSLFVSSQCAALLAPTHYSSYLCTKRSSLTIENVSIVSPLMVLKYASALCGSPPALKVINSAP